jgi:hypothetical protein
MIDWSNHPVKAIHDNAIDSKTERRMGTDRRRWTCCHDFPYVDSHGFLVQSNRREQLDRRQSNEKQRLKR